MTDSNPEGCLSQEYIEYKKSTSFGNKNIERAFKEEKAFWMEQSKVCPSMLKAASKISKKPKAAEEEKVELEKIIFSSSQSKLQMPMTKVTQRINDSCNEWHDAQGIEGVLQKVLISQILFAAPQIADNVTQRISSMTDGTNFTPDESVTSKQRQNRYFWDCAKPILECIDGSQATTQMLIICSSKVDVVDIAESLNDACKQLDLRVLVTFGGTRIRDDI